MNGDDLEQRWGSLADELDLTPKERREFFESMEQMRRGEGRVVHSDELRERRPASRLELIFKVIDWALSGGPLRWLTIYFGLVSLLVFAVVVAIVVAAAVLAD